MNSQMIDAILKRINKFNDKYWLARLKELDKRQSELDTKVAECTIAHIYVTYDTDHYEIWVGPDCLDLLEPDLTTFFTPAQATFIISHKANLSPCDALKFEHPYIPLMDHDDIKPNLLHYVGIEHINN